MHLKRFIVAANWKMNKIPADIPVFFREFLQTVESFPKRSKTAEVAIYPPALLAGAIQSEFESLQNSAAYPFFSMSWGGQNCYHKNSGAFTGENSPQTLAQMGAKSVLIGHSERRTLFQETDELLAQKVQAAQAVGLTPLLCIGETLEQRKSQQTQNVLKTQLSQGLRLAEWHKPFQIAYEPVWAIGTGVVATPEQVAESHTWIRQILTELRPKVAKDAHPLPSAEDIPILYGGSVNTENQAQLRPISEVNGFLIGGASLKGDSFAQFLQEL